MLIDTKPIYTKKLLIVLHLIKLFQKFFFVTYNLYFLVLIIKKFQVQFLVELFFNCFICRKFTKSYPSGLLNFTVLGTITEIWGP